MYVKEYLLCIGKFEMAAIEWEHIGHISILLKQKFTLINLWLLNFVNVYPCWDVAQHLLRIEIGRYERLPVEQRVCEMCDSDNVEDEMHFLIIL